MINNQSDSFPENPKDEPPGNIINKRLPFSFYPDYFEELLPPKLRKYYSRNGHLYLLKSLRVEVVTDLERCHELWQEFSPNATLFDTWEFRLAFYNGYKFIPHFYLLKTGEENLGLLPLWFETDKDPLKEGYFWFGSWWQEKNSFYVKDPLLTPLMLAVAPKPLLLNAISEDAIKWCKDFLEFKPDDPTFVLNISKMRSLDDYLIRFDKKKRYNLKRDKRIIEEQNPKIIYDNFADFKYVVNLSLQRFHDLGEDSDWEDPCRVKTFREVIKLGQKKNCSYQIRLITIKIGRKVAAADLVAIHKDCYYPLKCGNDVKNFPGIGNYMNLLEIEDAMNLGMKKVDFLEVGYGWKEKWFEEVPLYKYEKTTPGSLIFAPEL